MEQCQSKIANLVKQQKVQLDVQNTNLVRSKSSLARIEFHLIETSRSDHAERPQAPVQRNDQGRNETPVQRHHPRTQRSYSEAPEHSHDFENHHNQHQEQSHRRFRNDNADSHEGSHQETPTRVVNRRRQPRTPSENQEHSIGQEGHHESLQDQPESHCRAPQQREV